MKAEDVVAIEGFHRAWYRPGEQWVAELADIAASPATGLAAATAMVCDELRGVPSTRIVEIDLADGVTRILTQGPNSDRAPRWSPDGKAIAFLSDRQASFLFDLYLLDRDSGTERRVEGLNGWVEYHSWSADGRSLLLGVAGFEADLAGAQGGFSVAREQAETEAWRPEVDVGTRADSWRSLWIYDLGDQGLRRVSPEGVNVWEACWCGADAVVASCSDTPGEEAWYTAEVRRFALDGGTPTTLFRPTDQIGWLSASPSGATVAIVEAICSDRTIVAGTLNLIETGSGEARIVAIDADVTSTAWRGEGHLLLTALRGADNLILLHDVAAGETGELWSGRETTPSGGRFPEVFSLGRAPGDCLFVREGWFEPPTLHAIEGGKLRAIRRFGSEEVATAVARLGTARALSWTAPDGLEIEGWLVTPPGEGPHPLVMNIHGGPVWALRPRYLGRHFLHRTLLDAGYAVLDVNPRGSSGRGQDFARRVFGDMGGADTHDYLSGLTSLVEQGIADPARLGVTGGSYGGFMSAWLITQDQRFAAAVPVAPVTDWVSEHLTCHIPYFCKIFLDDDIDNPTGRYFTRSPIHFARQVTTPTLQICGALDKNTPAVQALEFHHALLENGVKSVLATYPQEGHGVRQMPAVFDYLARLLGWFEEHMPAKR
jgi:dipeptidyl aminopeptidase/acylaminoacyl peptidase